ncbi:hypothetical protein ACIQZB_38465 [Streptomyces sp. NPDC097727]|uniref:hypothetical protein n=1 Tax=Streptomyces sp. NPDC097727 TaxID=3366092 RepID=UPI0037F40B95
MPSPLWNVSPGGWRPTSRFSVDIVDGPQWDTVAQPLGVGEQAARSRLTHYALRR